MWANLIGDAMATPWFQSFSQLTKRDYSAEYDIAIRLQKRPRPVSGGPRQHIGRPGRRKWWEVFLRTN